VTPPREPRISIVICTRDRRDDLQRALASLRAAGAALAEAEIVVVEATDAPRPIPDTRYIAIPPGGGFGHARNRAVEAARGEILAFIDDDCEAEAGWLDALVAPLDADPAVAGVAGAVLVRGAGALGYAENVLGFPGGGLRYLHAAGGRVVDTRHLSTCNCAYRRDAVRRAGGFAEDARWGGEDFLLAERVAAAARCVYAPGAVVYHRPRGRLGAIFRWFVRRGRSEIALVALARERGALLRFVLRSSWTLRLAVVAALGLWRPPLLWLLPPAAVAYYAALLWRFRFARAWPTHRRAWWLVPVVKIVMDAGTEVGRWQGLLARERA
jgi:GT2 family glycosyltransferase